jgi:hypothetical protein
MILDIDETDVHSVSNAIAKLHKIRTRLCRTDPAARVSNVRFDKRLASIQKEYNAIKGIHEADVVSLYPIDEDQSTEHYVYAHCNSAAPLNIKDNARHLFAAENGFQFQPFYVGKGIGDRAYDLNRNEGHRKVKLLLDKLGKQIEVKIVAANLTKQEALAYEAKLIDIFGLKSVSKYGMLTNLDEGYNPTERRKMYPKGSAWYLNRMKLQPHTNSVP